MQQSPLAIYRERVDSGAFASDSSQLNAIKRLDRLWHQLIERKRQHWLARLLRRKPPQPRGLYMWGGVGRGKTWLMDLFFDSLPFEYKQRIHFHRFMARVHAELKKRERERDPLPSIARDWASRCRVLCFDEFFVSDIGDAMLLAGLLEALINEGVVLVATSNVQPDDLYRDGLQRSRFLPAIALLNEHAEIVEVSGDTDYRLRILEKSEIYHHPLGEAAHSMLRDRFADFCAGCEIDPILEINGRTFTCVRRGDGVVWFTFSELCEKPRSTADYIEIARAFNTVLLEGMPALDDKTSDPTRRLINLVDEFYDRNVKLLISAQTPIDEIYTGDRLAFEFQRTASRLTEMQSHQYLSRPHLA